MSLARFAHAARQTVGCRIRITTEPGPRSGDCETVGTRPNLRALWLRSTFLRQAFHTRKLVSFGLALLRSRSSHAPKEVFQLFAIELSFSAYSSANVHAERFDLLNRCGHI